MVIYMPKVITLDNIEVHDARIERRTEDEDTGEVDEEGKPVIVHVPRWRITVNYMMTNADNVKLRSTKVFHLPDQQADIEAFLAPFVRALKTETDIDKGEDWAGK